MESFKNINPNFSISHKFSESGAYQPTIHVADNKGNRASLQLLAVILSEQMIAPHPTLIESLLPYVAYALITSALILVARAAYFHKRVKNKAPLDN